MSLPAAHSPASASCGQHLEVGAQPLGRRREARVPERVPRVHLAAQVDGGDQLVARARVEAGEQAARAAQHRDRQRGVRAAQVGVAADDRHAEPPRRRRRCPAAAAPPLAAPRREQRVDDRERPAAHRVDVADVDHDRAVAGEAAARSPPAPATCPRRRAAGSPRRRGSPRSRRRGALGVAPRAAAQAGEVARRRPGCRACPDAERARSVAASSGSIAVLARRPPPARGPRLRRRRVPAPGRPASGGAACASSSSSSSVRQRRRRKNATFGRWTWRETASAPGARGADGGLHQPAPDASPRCESRACTPRRPPHQSPRPSPRCARRRPRARRRPSPSRQTIG